jgi:hypothetical protein
MDARPPALASTDAIEGGKTQRLLPAIPALGGPAPSLSSPAPEAAAEIGGPPGKDPTRYGDWEKNGRCIDF